MLNQQITEDISTACYLEDQMTELKSRILLLSRFVPMSELFHKFKAEKIKTAVLTYAKHLRQYRKIISEYV